MPLKATATLCGRTGTRKKQRNLRATICRSQQGPSSTSLCSTLQRSQVPS